MMTLLKTVAADIPAALISPAELSILQRLSQQLPEGQAAILECRLSEARPAADLSLCLRPRRTGAPAIKAACPDGEAWAGIRHFYHYWPALPQLAFLQRTWLEFDCIDKGAKALEQPCFFFGGNHDQLKVEEWIDRIQLVVDLINQPASGFTYSKDLLSFCLTQMQPSSRLFQIGLMAFRAVPSLRICVQDRSVKPLLKLLRSVGLREIAGVMMAELGAYFESCSKFGLHLDLGEELSLKASLECYPDAEGQWGDWPIFLNQLDQMDDLHRTKLAALKNWPGRHILAGDVQIRQLINHFKFLLEPGVKPKVKAYLYVGKHHPQTQKKHPLVR
ncbi:MAG: hypothetical protein AAGG75_23090 [Bacteroidota bacterium]